MTVFYSPSATHLMLFPVPLPPIPFISVKNPQQTTLVEKAGCSECVDEVHINTPPSITSSPF